MRMSVILIGEDDNDARAMLQRFLEQKGHVVRAVADGQAVVDELANDVFDIVILDAMMPLLSGFDALRHVRAQGNPTPIIIATARSDADDVMLAFEMGADDYVTKPFNLAVLLARIHHQLRNRAPVHFDVAMEDKSPVVAIGDPSREMTVHARPPPLTGETMALPVGEIISGEDVAEA